LHRGRRKSRRRRYGDAAQTPARLLAKMPDTSSNPSHMFRPAAGQFAISRIRAPENAAPDPPHGLTLLTTIQAEPIFTGCRS
jgi:hypothetical protein